MPLLSQHLWSGDKPRHILLAEQFVGTKEIGKNRGDWIDNWNRYTGAPIGSPYCASFVSWILYQAGVDEPKIKSPLARHFWTKAKSKLKYTAGDVLTNRRQVKQGDIVIWARGFTIYGHIGFAYENWKSKAGMTIEANTASGSGPQWEGDGVYIRYRSIEPYNYFRIIGFVEVIYN